ncbi:MAG: dipeptidase [Microbacteriaceae bacterium]|nr:dipeptidase [Microbacteriaceae bacterium]
MSVTNALLLSNSSNVNLAYLIHADDVINDFFSGVSEVVFAPWALADHDAYTAKVASAFDRHGIRVVGLHSVEDPAAAIRDAGGIYVGGGNTFRLTGALHALDLLEPIRAAVARQLRYSGASAGSLVACPTMRTTNDMPIVQPPSLETLGLIPFQLNCHYLDADPNSTHAGESRELRLREFHEDNDVAVLGLREGTWLRVQRHGESTSAAVGGTAVSPTAPGPAILHQRGQLPVEVSGDVSDLLSLTPRFDAPAAA